MIKKNSFICCILTFIFLLSSCIGYDDKDWLFGSKKIVNGHTMHSFYGTAV